MAICFTSDTHFGHRNILVHTGRPWETVDRMADALVTNINARVGEGDTLYILGDFSYRLSLAGAQPSCSDTKYRPL